MGANAEHNPYAAYFVISGLLPTGNPAEFEAFVPLLPWGRGETLPDEHALRILNWIDYQHVGGSSSVLYRNQRIRSGPFVRSRTIHFKSGCPGVFLEVTIPRKNEAEFRSAVDLCEQIRLCLPGSTDIVSIEINRDPLFSVMVEHQLDLLRHRHKLIERLKAMIRQADEQAVRDQLSELDLFHDDHYVFRLRRRSGELRYFLSFTPKARQLYPALPVEMDRGGLTIEAMYVAVCDLGERIRRGRHRTRLALVPRNDDQWAVSSGLTKPDELVH